MKATKKQDNEQTNFANLFSINYVRDQFNVCVVLQYKGSKNRNMINMQNLLILVNIFEF
jgi:hypothetical protein